MPDTPPEREPADTGRRRIRSALLKPSRSQVVVAVLLALVGFAAVTQVRVNEDDDQYSGQREQDLIDIFTALSGTRQRAEEQLAELQTVRDDLRSTTSRRQAALTEAQDDVDELRMLAGLVPVTGPGIRVTITEETGRVSLSSLLDTVQELRTVGAEAMQLNAEARIVAQTSFEETEGGFLVDGELVEAPYVLDVIGDPSVLASSLEFLLGPRKQLEEDGAALDVDELAALDIEAVRKLDEPDFSAPDE
ncbi:DUF881 domain-containing protein [Nocardioides sp. TF02-7]|uniref:DUF881 domain-containing protein n=1 Tax=Nocardioides sp. TF02-7 TaxID=2917724 RepID=UPI001F0630AF|nr:DUF881 domain-containing protein [Nocardioides sp. TF02-7]UMG92548.1 DUF881 domain-containing protein [Nocardioides sp. TF02-7]